MLLATNDPAHAALATDSSAVIAAIVTGAIALIVSLISAIATGRNRKKINENASELEHLKASLSHGQLISSTQWNAEFNAYQALWKAVVPVRMLALKVVNREGELTDLGLQPGDVSEVERIKNVERVLWQYTKASKICVMAINEHAPFYSAEIRKKANEVHALARVILRERMAALVTRKRGISLSPDQAVIADAKRQQELSQLVEGTDSLEGMIRKRMNEVQVFHSVTT